MDHEALWLLHRLYLRSWDPHVLEQTVAFASFGSWVLQVTKLQLKQVGDTISLVCSSRHLQVFLFIIISLWHHQFCQSSFWYIKPQGVAITMKRCLSRRSKRWTRITISSAVLAVLTSSINGTRHVFRNMSATSTIDIRSRTPKEPLLVAQHGSLNANPPFEIVDVARGILVEKN